MNGIKMYGLHFNKTVDAMREFENIVGKLERAAWELTQLHLETDISMIALFIGIQTENGQSKFSTVLSLFAKSYGRKTTVCERQQADFMSQCFEDEWDWMLVPYAYLGSLRIFCVVCGNVKIHTCDVEKKIVFSSN